MKDIVEELAATLREVAVRDGDVEELVVVVLRRTYPSEPEDVWDAITQPERLARWFAVVSGDLRAGGDFQVEGNVGGEIRVCAPPDRLLLTWGMPQSTVEVRLTAAGSSTVLELEHTVPRAFAGSGAGALYVGPGWDVSLLGLARWLRGEPVEDPARWEASDEVRAFNEGTVAAWAATVGASGTATPAEVDAAVEAARAQFLPAR